MSGAGELARVRDVLRIRAFRRLWLVLGISSLGDWMGLLATSTFVASQVSGSVAKGLAFGGVIAVRLLPALLLGPLAGVVADRFDRRRTLVVCDLSRFVLFASIPTVGLLGAAPAVVVGWAAVASVVVEAIGMVWSPTKEAAVPNLVPADRLETANQLSLATAFGITPVLGGLLVAGLSRGFTVVFGPAGAHGLGPGGVALYFNAATFLANAMVVWFGIREIGGRPVSRDGRETGHEVLRVLVDGWAYVSRTRLVRGLAAGILVAFAGAGAVIGTALFYVRSLGGSDATFGLLFGALFAGFGLGVAVGPVVVHDLSRRRWFGVSIALAGYSVVVFALAPHVAVAVPACVGIGAGAGMALLVGTTLLGGEVTDEVRGRVFAFVQTGCRVTLLLSIFVASVLVGVGGSHRVRLGGLDVSVSTSRVILLVTGVAMAAVGAFALRHIDDRSGVPVLADVWAALRGRPVGTSSPADEGPESLCVPDGGDDGRSMSIARRLALLFRVKANKVLDRAEDPREVLDYSYQRQTEMLATVRRGLADVATSRKRLELQEEQLRAAAERLRGQAADAVRLGRDDLAREALSRRSAALNQIEELRPQHDTLKSEEDKLTLAAQRLQAKVEAFRTRKETIKATYTAAEAQTHINEAVSGISEELGDVGLAMQRAEDRTAQMQSRAAALDELLASGALENVSAVGGPRDDIQAELDKAAAADGGDIDRQLAELKARRQISGEVAS